MSRMMEFLLASHSFEAFPVVGCMLMRGSCVSAEALLPGGLDS